MFNVLLIRLLVESRLMEPLEHSTSSEKDTLELVLDWRLEDDTDEDDTDDLSDLMGTTTGDSVLQYSRMRILTIYILQFKCLITIIIYLNI